MLEGIRQLTWEGRFAFLGAVITVLFVTFGILYVIDFYPEPLSEQTVDPSEELILKATHTDSDSVEKETSDEVANDAVELEDTSITEVPSQVEKVSATGALPKKIIIDALEREVEVLNPKSRVIADLDHALLDGVVRHPDSADFLDEGHMFLFGHSSYLPTVHNRNFQAFNGIQKLHWGDLIRVQSDDTEYIYRVVKSYQVKASQAEVELDHSKPRLTLATCNSFGSIDDRFVVEADLIAETPLEE